MQVGLRKHNMPGQNESGREADTECNNPSTYLGCDIPVTNNMKPLLVHNVCEGNTFEDDIQYGVGTATGKVSECLSRYHFGKGPVKEINNTYDDMSRLV